jgi:DNA-directed RNA polymerase specialized sigma24 family protein
MVARAQDKAFSGFFDSLSLELMQNVIKPCIRKSIGCIQDADFDDAVQSVWIRLLKSKKFLELCRSLFQAPRKTEKEIKRHLIAYTWVASKWEALSFLQRNKAKSKTTFLDPELIDTLSPAIDASVDDQEFVEAAFAIYSRVSDILPTVYLLKALEDQNLISIAEQLKCNVRILYKLQEKIKVSWNDGKPNTKIAELQQLAEEYHSNSTN